MAKSLDFWIVLYVFLGAIVLFFFNVMRSLFMKIWQWLLYVQIKLGAKLGKKTAPIQIQLDKVRLASSTGSAVFAVLMVIIGIAGMAISGDLLMGITFLAMLLAVAYANYRNSLSSRYVKTRTYLIDILRLFSSNLQTYQSTEESLENLHRQYSQMNKGIIDQSFLDGLKQGLLSVKQGQPLVETFDAIFGDHPVYYQFARVISMSDNSTPSHTIGYCNELINKTNRWRELSTMMNSEISGVKLSAFIMEFMLIAMLMATLLPSWGDTPNILRSYFFDTPSNRLLLLGIMVFHATAQFAMMEYLKSKLENL